MEELPNFTGDNESSEKKSDTSKDKQERWVPPLLAPRSFGLHREMFSMTRNPLESGKSEKDNDNEEEDENVDAERPVVQTGTSETTHAETTSSEEVAEAVPADASELSPDILPSTEVPLTEGANEERQPYDERPDEGILHIRGGGMSYPEAPLVAYNESEEDKSSNTDTSIPPPPPISGMPGHIPTPNWNTSPQTPGSERLSDAIPSAQISVEQHKQEVNETEYYAEKRGLRRGLVAGFITGYVVKAYLARRKSERYEKAAAAQLEKRDEQIARLQREQWQQNERLTAQIQEESRRRYQEQTAPAPQARPEAPIPKVAEVTPQTVNPEQQLFDQEGNEIILQPGWRVERSAGGYSVVLDEHNRIVHNAIHYGEAFKRDQKREQLSDDMLAVLGGGSSVSSQSDTTGMGALPVPMQQQSQLGDLPGQHPSADLNHRLPKPHSQIKSTATSPWLWTAIAILVIVYFVAQLA